MAGQPQNREIIGSFASRLPRSLFMLGEQEA
jgi:hypothetical protein